MLKGFVSNSNYLVYLYRVLRISLFRACVKEAILFIFLVRLTLFHIFGPRKDKVCCPVSNANWYLVLYLLYDNLNISSIFDGTIPFQYLKTLLAIQDSTRSETGSHFVFQRWIINIREQEARSRQKRMHLFCTAWSLCFRFLLRKENHDMKLWLKWG